MSGPITFHQNQQSVTPQRQFQTTNVAPPSESQRSTTSSAERSRLTTTRRSKVTAGKAKLREKKDISANIIQTAQPSLFLIGSASTNQYPAIPMVYQQA